MDRCRATKANGERCKLDAADQQGMCWAHSEANADARRKRASKGGRAKANREVQALRLQLQALTEQVVNGELEASRGAVANQLIATQIKLIELERRTRETDELAAEIQELKREHGKSA